MNKTLLTLSVASVLSLTACNESKLEGGPSVSPDLIAAETTIKFDLVSTEKQLVTPSFLLVDPVDGTLATDGNTGTAGYSTDIAQPMLAMGKTDGWSTTQPINIAFEGHNLDPETATAGFKMMESFNLKSSQPDMSKVKVLTPGIDYAVNASGTRLTVILLKPLKPSSHYIFAVTRSLKDDTGKPVGTSGSYSALKSTYDISPALKPAREVVHATEKIIMQAAGIENRDIIFSSWFSTASVGVALQATKSLIAKAIQAGDASQVWVEGANPNNIDTTGMFQLSGNPIDKTADFTSNTNLMTAYNDLGLQVYQGSVNLPYFLETDVSTGRWATTPWQSAAPSLAKLSYHLNDGQVEDKVALLLQLKTFGITTEDLNNLSDAASQQTLLLKLIGKTLTLADGSLLDEERLITRYSPLPQLKSMQAVPYILVMPDAAHCDSSGPGSNHIPLTIFQHGINNSKESIYSLALGMMGGKVIHEGNEAVVPTSRQCQAIIAIDHPLHGERGLSDTIVTTSQHPEIYMNLAHLPVARDNLRQSAIDVVSLRAVLGTLIGNDNAPIPFNHLSLDTEGTKGIGFVGVSLGAMAGIAATATTNQQGVEASAGEVSLFAFTRAHFSVPGGAIPYTLLNSDKFGSQITGLLSPGFEAYKASSCMGLDDNTCKVLFYNGFVTAAQTILDTIDPINHINRISDTMPAFLTMVKGDKVIPNTTVGAGLLISSVLGGTRPLIDVGNYEPVTETVEAVGHKAAVYKTGEHRSLVIPATADDLSTTAEMQGQSASFLWHESIEVNNPDILEAL